MAIMKQIGKILGNSNVLLALVIILLVWFLLPQLSVRLLVLAMLACAALSNVAINLLQKHKDQAFPLLCNNIKSGCAASKNACRMLFYSGKVHFQEFKYQMQRGQQNRRLRRLPWYLVLGSAQSGKKTLLANFNLYYAKAEHFGEEASHYRKQFPDLEWWFSEQAVFIDPLNKDRDRDVEAWRKLRKLLKKQRHHKPLNGIILTFCLADLMLFNNQKRQDFIQDICRTIRDLHETFNCLVPVYLVLTKCDQIEGFMEFFNDLSQEELKQVWGMTIPLHECTDLNAVQSFFSHEYNSLVEQLRKRVLWAFDSERNLRGRELILNFPQQMQLLKKPIENFLVELFGATRYHKALQMRGLYFISSKQEGEPFDFLLAAMSKKFQLLPPTVHRPQRLGECYFARNLFHEVIFREASILGDSERSKRIRNWTYKLCTLAAPLLVLLAGTAMYQGYTDNLTHLKLLNQHIANYQTAVQHLEQNNSSLSQLIPVLDELHVAVNLYQNKTWAMRSVYESYAISRSLNNTLQRALHSLYLPRIAAQIENNLNQNIPNQNLLYANLKGYLAFSASDYSKRSAITAPMEYHWNKDYLPQPATQSKLKYYLHIAIQNALAKLPLDRNLINRIRGQLAAIIPANRAYGLLELSASVSDLPVLILNSASGNNFNNIFSHNGNITISALYTRSGYAHNFLPQYQNIAEEVAQDNQDIGLANDSVATQSSRQIAQLMQITYNKHYIADWQQALAHIQVLEFSNLSQAVTAINNLTSKQSPLAKLLAIIYDNTSSIANHDKVQVNKAFQALNAYSQDQAYHVSWQQTQKTLTNLASYLQKIATATDPNAAALQAAQDVISGKANPILDLSRQAKDAPEPMKRWLNAIANNCWQIIVLNAHDKLNALWTEQVMSQYDASIKGRYPLLSTSESQIALADFNQFFSNDGILQSYFNSYIKPFVNVSGNTWRLASIAGHSIQLPANSIALFKQAQSIRNSFFSNGAKQASLAFAITPLNLDSNASSMQLQLGTQNLNYSHGPQFPMTVTWPLPFNSQLAQLLISGFNGNQYTDTVNGPWALFKLLQYGNLTETSSTGNYQWDLNLNGLTASFTLSGSATIDTYQLSTLKDFCLPNNIATLNR